ncbi:hypothetical protein CEXT_459091 [Caerostris extrusa]|uniref:Uncharacterized protein n=1 Tax=Caerostris extrusa TaxID=172846 RepID=A0AAV4Y5P9_CAEEX|nr:hypothetical protein CEXT_459091 [Caerostris extrusa]
MSNASLASLSINRDILTDFLNRSSIMDEENFRILSDSNTPSALSAPCFSNPCGGRPGVVSGTNRKKFSCSLFRSGVAKRMFPTLKNNHGNRFRKRGDIFNGCSRQWMGRYL